MSETPPALPSAPALLAAALLAVVAAPSLAVTDPPPPAVGPVGAAAEPAQSGASPGLATARTQLDAGNLDAALVALKSALRDNPSDAEALLLLAEVLLARFDAAGAETTLRQAREAGAGKAAVYPDLAKALILQDRAAEVLEQLAPAADMDGQSRARLLAQHFAARMVLGDTAAAARLLDEAQAASVQVPELFAARAAMAAADGDLEAARQQLQAAAALLQRDDEPWLILGRLEQVAGDTAAAEAAYTRGIERAPVHWRSAHARALLRLDAGDLDGAEADIALAEAQFPDFLGLAYAKARLDLARGRATDAANGFELYLRGMPADTNALFYAAYTANVLGSRQQAYDYLERLQAAEGATPRLLLLKARTLLADDDPAGAWALLEGAVASDAPPPQLVVPAQSALLRLGRMDEALGLVVRARAAAPESDALLAAEARLRLAGGELEQAEALVGELAQRAPKSVEALILRAQLAAQRKQVSDALLAEVRAARTQAPQDSRLPLLLAALHGARGETEPACGVLVEALRQDPTADSVIARLRGLDCANRTPELLQDAYQDLLASHPDAVRALPALLALGTGGADADGGLSQLQAAVQADPGNADLRASLVATLLQAQRTAAAAEVLEATPPEQLGEAAILRATGLLAMVREDPDAAVRAFQALLGASPGTAAPAYLLADAQAQAGDLSGARYHLSEGLRLDPDHGLARIAAARIFAADASLEARRRLIDDIKRQAPDSLLVPSLQAQTLFDAGRPDKAAELLQQMHEARPEDPQLLARLLMTLNAAERSAEAKALGERWAAGRASAGNPADAGVALLLGDLNAMDGDMDRAAHWYRQVLEQVPSQPTALNNLAVILADSDPNQAVQLAERALQQAPKDPEVMDTLGMALLAAGDSARARALLNQAYALSNQRPLIGLNLARAVAADGEPARAREVLQSVVRQDFAEQAEARALMRSLATR